MQHNDDAGGGGGMVGWTMSGNRGGRRGGLNHIDVIENQQTPSFISKLQKTIEVSRDEETE